MQPNHCKHSGFFISRYGPLPVYGICRNYATETDANVMLATTYQICKSGLQADPSITPSDRTRLLALLRNGTSNDKPESPPPDATPRLIRRSEAAKRLACSLRLVDRLAKDGILPKRKLPGRVRASGFLESDVVALLTQKANA